MVQKNGRWQGIRKPTQNAAEKGQIDQMSSMAYNLANVLPCQYPEAREEVLQIPKEKLPTYLVRQFIEK